MNRAAICGIIFGFIIISALLSISLLRHSTEDIFELIDRVTLAYESGDIRKTEDEISKLEDSWEVYYKRLSFLVPSNSLVDISYDIAKLRHLCRSGADDFIAECKGIRYRTALICERELPRLYSIF